MTVVTIESFIATLAFAGIFLFGGRLHARTSPRAALSFGAGVSVSYVFIHMFPEMAETGSAFVREAEGLRLPAPELRIYASALFGFVVFYGLEHMVARSRVKPLRGDSGTSWIPFLHVGGFALYGAIVPYLMVRGITERVTPLSLYALAMGLHFLSLEHALRHEHAKEYTRWGRFVLAGAVVAGWVAAVLFPIPIPILVSGIGFVSGGVVMNSMIMELPDEKDGRFLPFLLGATGYAAVLVAVR